MTKGLFTSIEEIRFHNAFIKGHIAPVKNSSMVLSNVRQDNRRVAQNLKRINQRQKCSVWRER